MNRRPAVRRSHVGAPGPGQGPARRGEGVGKAASKFTLTAPADKLALLDARANTAPSSEASAAARQDAPQAASATPGNSGLGREIAMLRRLIERLSGQVDEIEEVEQRLAAMRVILQAYGRLAILLRTQQQIEGTPQGGMPEPLAQAIREALQELRSRGEHAA